jgi:O-methyltransferase involved in polyketide biosynthesis
VATERHDETAADFDWGWVDEGVGDWVPPQLDQHKPSVARIYDYYLGGKDNFEIDRKAAADIIKVVPDVRDQAAANRRFLTRAVRYLAEAGISQFIDLGSGLPTSPSVHELARAANPDARVVYIDTDPIVLAHNRALLATDRNIVTKSLDLQKPATVLDDPQVLGVIDFTKPVGLIFVAVFHFVPVDLAPSMLSAYRKAVPPGSGIALSAACRDRMSADTIRKLQAIYSQSTNPFVFRSAAQIEQLFEGFDLVEPGLADLNSWHSDDETTPTDLLAGVGIKP